MKKYCVLALLLLARHSASAQRVLISWSQQNIEHYTKEQYDAGQRLSAAELLAKNRNDRYWSDVFVTLNASVNRYGHDTAYWKELAKQLTDTTQTALQGTSRLIIWDRIVSGDIVFEGKGLVVDNDLYTVAGRANQLLQSLSRQSFSNVGKYTTPAELEQLQARWMDFLANKPVPTFKPTEYPHAKIAEISSPEAVHALIVSLKDSPAKRRLTSNCLKKVYQLDEMPADKSAAAQYCNPDTYTFSYLALLLGHEKRDETKDAAWWQAFWEKNGSKLAWNDEKGFYEVKP